MKVTFDGPNKLIIINEGITSLDVRTDIYSAWKEWMTEEDNSKYLLAFSVEGGAPTPSGFTGTTFFLENGWKIRPYEGDHSLTVTGNLFTRTGQSPFVPTLGYYNVLIEKDRSNIVDTVYAGGGSGLTLGDIESSSVLAKEESISALPTIQDIENSSVLAKESSITARPTLTEIEASSVLAKESTIAAKPSLSDIEASTVIAKEATIATKPTLTEIEASTVIAKEETIAARPTLTQIEGSTVIAKEETIAARPTLTQIEGSTKIAKEETIAARPTLTQIEESAVIAKQSETLRALGLLQENQYIDMILTVNGKVVSMRKRIYDSAEHVGTDNGVIATYGVEAEYTNGVFSSCKVTKV